MKSFAYLIPRIFIVGLLVLAAVLGAEPLLRSFLIRNLESSVGAKVNISRISTRLADGKVYLRDFSIGDPGRPMENLLQADLTYLKFNAHNLLSRQVAIEKARSSHVRFGAPRTQPGSLWDQGSETGSVEIRPTLFSDSQDSIAVAWLDQFKRRFSTAPLDDTPVTLFAVAKATNERWNRDFQLHHEKLDSVNQKLLQLVDSAPGLLQLTEGRFPNSLLGGEIEERHAVENKHAGETDQPQRFNPLRLASDAKAVPVLLKEAVSAIDDLKRQQLVLQRNAQADIEALDIAFKKDTSVNSQLEIGDNVQVLPQTINDLLLVKFHQQVAVDAIQWFAWVNEKSKHAVPPRKSKRGIEHFVNHFSKPNLVIDQLEIDGEGAFANEHFHFAGHAFDLSDHPAGHDRPVRFEIRAQGQRHFHLDCVLDHRAGRDQNRLLVEFPSFGLGEQVLGTQDELLVSLSPGTKISGRIELNSDRDEITGTMELSFANVALVVEHLHEVAGGKVVEVRLNHQLATLNHFQTKAVIGGPVDTPMLTVESDLGNRFADAIETVSKKTLENSVMVRNQKLEEFYRSRVRVLQQNIKTEVEKITGVLDDQISKTEIIQGTTQRTAGLRWPNLR